MRTNILILVLVALVAPLASALSVPSPNLPPNAGVVFDTTDALPLPNQGHLRAHDPNILAHNGSYYLFKGGWHLPFFRSDSLSGPWEEVGHVFNKDSIIHKPHADRPWAPTTIERNGTFYCYYAVSSNGSRDSAIGVATTNTLDGKPWTDHGAIINTGSGPLSRVYPFSVSNAIDASVITDVDTGKTYLNYGSFWHNMWQVPLADNLLSVEDAGNPNAVQLAFIPYREMIRPEEGSFMSYRDGFYYLWYSRGKCCHFENGFPESGMEYDIRVGRSENVRGPFIDRKGRLLLAGGGTIVYASNHGRVYAPGGIGVLPGNSTNGNNSTHDILYYHYLNTTVGFENQDAFLGWNFLKYDDGWPVVMAGDHIDEPPAKNETVPDPDPVNSGPGNNGPAHDGTSDNSTANKGKGDDGEHNTASVYGLPSWLYWACLMSFWLYFDL